MNLKSLLNSIFRGNKRDTVNTHLILGNMRNAINRHGLRRLEGEPVNMRNAIITNSLGNKRNAIIISVVSGFKRITINTQPFHLPILLSAFILVFVVSCKKEKGIVNIEWQNESLSLTAEICAKYRNCADKEWKSIPENLKKFTEGRLEETQCQKRFRESNAYKLIGADPLAIQSTYKECHGNILRFSCQDLQEGKIDTVGACLAFQKIQNGN
ncbi:LA_2478/LA_2722/LA_4182 family protein [Leptospira brenneri]|uniref:LA_2478/LA_2722/LA_4182 family protein n=1 Tax=Leptospira brenneri TaxID=2023182 RepID=UPI001FCC9C91|nr:hypothetical protein [Leptospira brenneri]